MQQSMILYNTDDVVGEAYLSSMLLLSSILTSSHRDFILANKIVGSSDSNKSNVDATLG
jgi:hypothetical protein